MARITFVKKSRKEATCEQCQETIPVGSAYSWWAPRFGPRRVRCATCPTWSRSEMTGSMHRATVYDAIDNAELPDWIDFTEEDDPVQSYMDALTGIAQDVASQCQDAVDSLNESADNMEEGFGHSTYQSDELRERADNLDSAISDLDSFDPYPYEPDPEDDDDDTAANMQSWADEQRDELQTLMDACDEAVG